MKKIPMILLLIAPWAILALCGLAGMDLAPGLFVYGAFLLFNMVYAFVLPKLGFNGKQLLFWNLLLKLLHIPVILLILLVLLITTLVGGETVLTNAPFVIPAMLLACYVLQLSSAMFGISGFIWCGKYGNVSAAGVVASTIVQLIPGVDVIGSILCYIMFRKDGEHPYP